MLVVSMCQIYAFNTKTNAIDGNDDDGDDEDDEDDDDEGTRPSNSRFYFYFGLVLLLWVKSNFTKITLLLPFLFLW